MCVYACEHDFVADPCDMACEGWIGGFMVIKMVDDYEITCACV